jgi:iron-sulfur cluster assembly accessory protein
MITVTAKANQKLKEFSEAEGIGHCSVRVKVKGGGCSGYEFDLEFDDQSTETDEVIESEGVQVIVDMMSAQYMEGIVMDYEEGSLGAGFSFKGGKISSRCGCGSSVSFDDAKEINEPT